MTAVEALRSRAARIARALGEVRLGPLRGIGLWGSVLVVLAFLAVSVPQYGDPYVIDEAVFPYVADGILTNGAPFFYNGETRPVDVGLWHPPVYDYLLAGQVAVFGMTPFAVRAFGAVCVVLAVYVLALALRRVAPAVPPYGYVLLAALVLLNPLVIAGALVPDIDGTLGVLLVAIALWVATCVAPSGPSWRLAVGLTGLATAAVATKFTIAGLVALLVGVSALLSSTRRWATTGMVVACFAVGTAIALALLVLAGALIGFDARAPFDYLFGSLSSRAPGRTGLAGLLANLTVAPGSPLVWIGPALLVAAALAVILVAIRRLPGVAGRLVVLAAVAGLAMVVGYAYISASPFGFPKYTPIAVPAFALAAAPLAGLLPGAFAAAAGERRHEGVRGAVLVGAYVAVLALGTGGMLVLERRGIAHPRVLVDVLLLGAGCFLAVMAAATVLVLALRRSTADPGSRGWRAPLVAGALLAVLLTPVMTATSEAVVDAAAPFSTRYYYGERGLAEFLARAGEIVPEGAEIIAPKDVGLQLGARYYEDAMLLYMPLDEFRAEIERIAAPYFVTRSLWDYSEAVFPAQFDVIREYYEPVVADSDLDFTLWALRER